MRDPVPKLHGLSIFFPAYYDENTIEPLVRKAIEVGRKLAHDLEVIIVDDKSPDRTGEIADRLSAEFREVKVVHHPVNRGVGQAMISGWRTATKEYVFYTDGDAQYDLGELESLAAHAGSFDAVVGYRMKRAEGWTRVFTNRCFHLLLFLFFGIHFRDTDCSFKLLRRRFLDRITFYTGGGLVDAEILIQARKFGVPVKEVGVRHYPRRFGSSRCLRPGLVFSMLRDLVRLRFMLR